MDTDRARLVRRPAQAKILLWPKRHWTLTSQHGTASGAGGCSLGHGTQGSHAHSPACPPGPGHPPPQRGQWLRPFVHFDEVPVAPSASLSPSVVCKETGAFTWGSWQFPQLPA